MQLQSGQGQNIGNTGAAGLSAFRHGILNTTIHII